MKMLLTMCVGKDVLFQAVYTLFADDKEVQEFLNNSVAFKTKIESIQKGELFQRNYFYNQLNQIVF